MLEILKAEEKKVVDVEVKAGAEFFIIPNSACVGRDALQTHRLVELDRFTMDNGGKFLDEDKDKIVEIWITSKEDLGSENLGDHGAIIKLDDESKIHIPCCYTAGVMSHIPEKLIRGMKEGDSKEFVYNIVVPEGKSYDDNPEYHITIHLTITAAQKKYRYSRFGNFEDVLDRVTL